MKAIKFKESEYYSIHLTHIGTYLIDGNPVVVTSYNQLVQVKDINHVHRITRTSIVSYYINSKEERMEVEAYNEQKLLLHSNFIYNEDTGISSWLSLEDEFAYRKFIAEWTPINKEIEEIGDPYSFEVIESVIDTGNPFIKSDYINGGDDPLLFQYDRAAAAIHIVKEKFQSLGMEFKGDIDYGSTKNEKIWGNATHSGIRYVTAFGTYVFNDAFNFKNTRGKLDVLLKTYKEDKKSIELCIQLKYNAHFGRIIIGEVDFEKLTSLTNQAIIASGSVDYKKTSYDAYKRLRAVLFELRDVINQHLIK